MTSILLPAVIIIVAILGIGFAYGALYKQATRDKAYVRTGLGGKKVVLDGGSVVLPVFQSLAWVRLNTLRLEVRRAEKESLITKDRMRADVSAEFYVRVKPDAESIAVAAQTLGDRTNDAAQLSTLIEAKFVDALRSVAAKMTLVELQEQRTDFVKAVQTTVAHDLESNGLELESVSLTRLDQTDKSHFNENNTFDAEGLTALTKITEARRNERNTVIRETEVSIAEKDRETALKQLEISRGTREAELSQERDIANKTAETRAETALAEQRAQQSEQTARIEREQAIAQREAEANKAKETARIESAQAVATRTTESQRDIRLAEQDAAIQVSERSKAESEAKALAEEARALSVAAEERVDTARATETAERARKIAVIQARQEAERAATGITVEAEAEAKAAENLATAVKTRAEAEAEANRVRADGVRALGDAEAARERAMNEARNTLSPAVIEFELTRERIRIVPQALGETMKAVEKIESIRIVDASGLLARGGAGGEGSGATGVDGLFEKLLAYQAQKPIVSDVLRSAGFEGIGTIDALNSALVGTKLAQEDGREAGAAPAVEPAAVAVPAAEPATPRGGRGRRTDAPQA